ncbi:hypothetical protein DYB36_010381 [Aphanomyces astaci]|uniref:Major facilitator superfamily (MFS) profile domain-containing protein n=1 Tax=Aphanomyces astaci TaxID=112090 RepID=A0A397BI76_APHAT|nr:hypothetical protein DYB36_010381 [Aphanomyces astaci]
MDYIANYWRLVVPVKSTAELTAEEFLFVLPWVAPHEFVSSSCIAFTRWRLLVVCVLGHACIGSFMAFNTLMEGFDVYFYGHHTGATIQVMLLSFVFFGFSAAFIGPFVETNPPRVSLATGTGLVAMGYLLSQLAVVGQRMTLVNYNLLQDHHDTLTDVHYFQQVKAMSLLQCIASADFVLLYIGFAANAIPGMLFATEVYDIATGVFNKPSDVTNLLVFQGFFFYANPAFARKAVFVTLLTAQLLAFSAAHAATSFDSFRLVLIVVVFCSGGGFALLPCYVTDMFGVYHTATMCGLALTCWSLRAVVVGYAFAAFRVTQESLGRQFDWLLILVAVGWVASLLVRTNSMDRFYFGYQYSVCGKVMLRIGGGPGIPIDVVEGSLAILETARDRISSSTR